MQLRGEGEWPRLKFDVRECILPPVPVGIKAEAQFFVINDGYDNLELKASDLSLSLRCTAARTSQDP